MNKEKMTGYPSIDRPWLKYYPGGEADAVLPECTIYQYLYQQNKDFCEDTALNYFDRKISYGKLFENIADTAKAFRAIGVKKGDVIVLATVTTPETVYTYYALNLLGAVPNMVDPRTSVEGIREYFIEAENEIVLVIDAAAGKIAEAAKGTNVKKIISVSPADSLPLVKKAAYTGAGKIRKNRSTLPEYCIMWNEFISESSKADLPKQIYGKDCCSIIVHTGGTTGVPKGVMLSDDAVNAVAFQMKLLGSFFRRGKRFLNVMPPFIAYGAVCGIHMPLSCGMEVVLIPKLEQEKLPGLIKKYKPNSMMGVPVHYAELAASSKLQGMNLGHMDACGVGGDGILPAVEKEINQFLREHGAPYLISKGYGMTELSAAAASCFGECNRDGSVGIPFCKNIISVFEPGTDRELPIGQTGEICVHSPSAMLGYYKNPQETENLLWLHEDGRAWVHSGDIGYMDEDGFIYIMNRIKRLLIRHDGFKVFPSMIEKTVASHPEVELCCAVGITDKEHPQGQLPLVFVVLKPECRTAEEEIKMQLHDLCRKELPEYAQPVNFRIIEKLPVTPAGKVDFRTLERRVKAQEKKIAAHSGKLPE